MTEHILGEPKAETVGYKRKNTAFDAIENPEKGWVTTAVLRTETHGETPLWRIDLLHPADGATVTHEAESLYVAWARATEAAHMMNIGLN